MARAFNILIVAQKGRLEYEAVAFAASLRRASPGFAGRLIVAEPQPDGRWSGTETLMGEATRQALAHYGAEILPFTAQHFGRSYPYGNKIEALSVLPEGEPFLFFDTDTLILGELAGLDPAHPAASMRRSATWPEPPLYGPGYAAIWRSLYHRFGLDFDSSLDLSQPDEHWERYLYFNAGWFCGPDPAEFGRRFTDYACAVRDEPGDALACQSLDPWLDQVVLPLVIHGLGGGRPGEAHAGLDERLSCHYRFLAQIYAVESDTAVEAAEALAEDKPARRVLRDWEAFRLITLRGAGRKKIRPLFDRDAPQSERGIRNTLRKAGYLIR